MKKNLVPNDSPSRALSRASDVAADTAPLPATGRLSEMLVHRRPTALNVRPAVRNRVTSISQQTVALSSLTSKRLADSNAAAAAASSTSPTRGSHGSPIPLLHLTVVEKIRLRLMYDVAANQISSSTTTDSNGVTGRGTSRLMANNNNGTSSSAENAAASTHCPLLLQDYVVLSLLHRTGIRPIPPTAELKKIVTRVAHANATTVLAPPDEDGEIGTAVEIPSVISFDMFLQIVEVVKRWALREAELDEVGMAFQQLTQNQKRVANLSGRGSIGRSNSALDASGIDAALPVVSVQDRSLTPRLSIVDDALEPRRQTSAMERGAPNTNPKFLSVGTLKDIVAQGGADFDMETLLRSVDPNFEEHKGGKIDLKLFRWIAGEDDPDVVRAFVSLGGEVSLSGTIPVEQLVEKCEALQMTPQYIANFVSALDVNNDGVVDFNEFLSLIARSRRDVNAPKSKSSGESSTSVSNNAAAASASTPTAPPVVTMRAKSLFNAENDGETVAPDTLDGIPENTGLLNAERRSTGGQSLGNNEGEDPFPRRRKFHRESNAFTDTTTNSLNRSSLPPQMPAAPSPAKDAERELFERTVNAAFDQDVTIVADHDDDGDDDNDDDKPDSGTRSGSEEDAAAERDESEGETLTMLDRLATAADEDAEHRRAARLMRKRQSVTETHLGIGLSGKLVDMGGRDASSASHTRHRSAASQLREKLELTARQARSTIHHLRERSEASVKQLRSSRQRVLVKVEGGLVDADVCQGPKGEHRMLVERARVRSQSAAATTPTTTTTYRVASVEGLEDDEEFTRKRTARRKVDGVSPRLTTLPKHRMAALQREVGYLVASTQPKPTSSSTAPHRAAPLVGGGVGVGTPYGITLSAPLPSAAPICVTHDDSAPPDVAPEHRHYRELKRQASGLANEAVTRQSESAPLPQAAIVPTLRSAEPIEGLESPVKPPKPQQRPSSAAVHRPRPWSAASTPLDSQQLPDAAALWRLLEENRVRLERAKTPSGFQHHHHQDTLQSNNTNNNSQQSVQSARKAFARTIASHVAMRMPLDDPQWVQAPTPQNIFQAYILKAPQPKAPQTKRPASATTRGNHAASAPQASSRPAAPAPPAVAVAATPTPPVPVKPHRPQTAPAARLRPASAKASRPQPQQRSSRPPSSTAQWIAHEEDDDPQIENTDGDRDVDVAYL
jgi:hypothetical protein